MRQRERRHSKLRSALRHTRSIISSPSTTTTILYGFSFPFQHNEFKQRSPHPSFWHPSAVYVINRSFAGSSPIRCTFPIPISFRSNNKHWATLRTSPWFVSRRMLNVDLPGCKRALLVDHGMRHAEDCLAAFFALQLQLILAKLI
jgi:hypothetical protein